MKKQTKIIATLGPASHSPFMIRQLIEAGTDVFRINASHQHDRQATISLVKTIRQTALAADKWVAILLDLQGPKIRIGPCQQNGILLETGQSFTFYCADRQGDETGVSISDPSILNDLAVGEAIYLDDGRVQCEVTSLTDIGVVCVIKQGGPLSDYKGMNFPDSVLTVSPITDKDNHDIQTAIESEVDYIALSFVSHAKDIHLLRKKLEINGPNHIHIIAKIERQKAIDNLVSIIEAADGIMVARGDLGVEVGLEKVPHYQKQMIQEANQHAKPVIVATQMLDSMIERKTATRAEVSDIANAIYDGCDSVMLSGETAVGIDPVNVVETMLTICQETDRKVTQSHVSFHKQTTATSFCKAADQIACENDVHSILCFTSSGSTPRIASKLKSAYPLIAPTDDVRICRRLALYRGVMPLLLPKKFHHMIRWREMINLAILNSFDRHWLKPGDRVIVTAGIPIGQSNGINSIRLVTIGQRTSHIKESSDYHDPTL